MIDAIQNSQVIQHQKEQDTKKTELENNRSSVLETS